AAAATGRSRAAAAGRGRAMSSRRPGPRRRGGGRPTDAHRDRKQRQLAAQIARSIETTLLGESRDEVLQNMSVASVEPAPGNRMIVTLTVHPPGTALSREEVLARLEAHRRLLVERVAQDISRRIVPELSFWVVREGPAAAAPGPPEPPPV